MNLHTLLFHILLVKQGDYALHLLILEYYNNGRQESPETIAQMIAMITLNDPMKAMQNMNGKES
ncbi:hypothetical protein ROU88_05830 [Macrococcus capreoli]|uniref:hypothetical protein n=1 Tax=Macrococcus capreoli TaxID=2982690 RepID=UPI0021D5B038|nr:hypothetical protein [Macrococcus sp. TMW 2.2395]MCU7558235.1 hypothetical protein [Macrococcus sp. TMW 2.2395]